MKTLLTALIIVCSTFCSLAQSRYLRYLTNVTDLVAVNPSGNDYNIFLLGYHTAGDGGGGFMTWTPGSVLATNLGNSIPSAYAGAPAGRYLDPFRFIVVNAKRFGAKADGVSDDTASLKSAIAYARTFTGQRPFLYLPKGAYVISDELYIDFNDTAIRGDGRYDTTILNTTANKGCFRLGGSGILISDLGISFSAANSTAGITFDTDVSTINYLATEITLRNVAVIGLGTGTGPAYAVDFHPTSGVPFGDGNFYSSHNSIDNCQFLGWTTAGINASRTNVSVNTSAITGATVISGRASFASDDSTGITLRHFQALSIDHGTAIQQTARGIQVSASSVQSALSLDSLYFEAFSQAAIQIAGGGNQCEGSIKNLHLSQTSLAGTTNAVLKLSKFKGKLDLLSAKIFGTIDSTHKAVDIDDGTGTLIDLYAADYNLTPTAYDWGSPEACVNYLQDGRFGNDPGLPGTFSIIGHDTQFPLVVTTTNNMQPLAKFVSQGTGPSYAGLVFETATNGTPTEVRNYFVGPSVMEYSDFTVRRGVAKGDDPVSAGTNLYRISLTGDHEFYGKLTNKVFGITSGAGISAENLSTGAVNVGYQWVANDAALNTNSRNWALVMNPTNQAYGAMALRTAGAFGEDPLAPSGLERLIIDGAGQVIVPFLTASKYVKTDASKGLVSSDAVSSVSVSASVLTNLFTLGVSNPTTTPLISAAATDPGANTLWGWDDTDNLPVQIALGGGLIYTHSSHTLSTSNTITSISSGNITNLWTVSIANPTTTPSFSFNVVDQGAHTLYGFDNTDNQATPVIIGSGLAYDHTTHTLSSTGGGGGSATNAYGIVMDNGVALPAQTNLNVIHNAGVTLTNDTTLGATGIWIQQTPSSGRLLSEDRVINTTEGIQGGSVNLSADRTFKLDFNGLTVAAPDPVADYAAFYDTSAGEHKKALIQNLGGGFNGSYKSKVLADNTCTDLITFSLPVNKTGAGASIEGAVVAITTTSISTKRFHMEAALVRLDTAGGNSATTQINVDECNCPAGDILLSDCGGTYFGVGSVTPQISVQYLGAGTLSSLIVYFQTRAYGPVNVTFP